MYSKKTRLISSRIKRAGLSLLGLCEAEGDLADRIGRPVGIVLVSGLHGVEADEFPKIVEAI
jgi:hypothetical protein